MKFNRFVGLLLFVTCTFFMTSCEKEEDVLNGVVGIEIVEAPSNKSIVDLNDGSQQIKVEFSTHTKLEEVYVHLFVEDNSKFNITNDKVVLKDDACLSLFPTEAEMIIDFKKTDLEEKEFVFEETVDLSKYKEGTCFVLFGAAKGISTISEGTNSKGIYFCKQGKVE